MDPVSQYIEFLQQRAIQNEAAAARSRAQQAEALAQGIARAGAGIAAGITRGLDRRWQIQDRLAEQDFRREMARDAEERARRQAEYEAQLQIERDKTLADYRTKLELEKLRTLQEQQRAEEERIAGEQAKGWQHFLQTGRLDQLPAPVAAEVSRHLAEQQLARAGSMGLTPSELADYDKLVNQYAAALLEPAPTTQPAATQPAEQGPPDDAAAMAVMDALTPTERHNVARLISAENRTLNDPTLNDQQRQTALGEIRGRLAAYAQVGQARRGILRPDEPQAKEVSPGIFVVTTPDGKSQIMQMSPLHIAAAADPKQQRQLGAMLEYLGRVAGETGAEFTVTEKGAIVPTFNDRRKAADEEISTTAIVKLAMDIHEKWRQEARQAAMQQLLGYAASPSGELPKPAAAPPLSAAIEEAARLLQLGRDVRQQLGQPTTQPATRLPTTGPATRLFTGADSAPAARLFSAGGQGAGGISGALDAAIAGYDDDQSVQAAAARVRAAGQELDRLGVRDMGTGAKTNAKATKAIEDFRRAVEELRAAVAAAEARQTPKRRLE